MRQVHAKGPTVKCVDISHYEPKVNWKILKAAGIGCVMLKASEGLDVRDSMFATHRANAKAVGMMTGAYHFFHAGKDPRVQARFFADVVGELDPTDLPPQLDLENGGKDGEPPFENAAASIAAKNELVRIYQRKLITYVGPFYMEDDLGSPDGLADTDLWLADYNLQKGPRVPDPFDDWKFCQFTESGIVAGINKPVDMSLFNGSMDDLLAFQKASFIS